MDDLLKSYGQIRK